MNLDVELKEKVVYHGSKIDLRGEIFTVERIPCGEMDIDLRGFALAPLNGRGTLLNVSRGSFTSATQLRGL